MFFIGPILCLLVFLCLKSLLYELEAVQNRKITNTSMGNVSIANLFPDLVLDSWISESAPRSNAWKAGDENEIPLSKKKRRLEESGGKFPARHRTTNGASFEGIHIEELQSDMAAQPSSREIFVSTLFSPPECSDCFQPDWDVVLGSFQHHSDQNWNNFLIKTEVPFLVRMVLGDSSEEINIWKEAKTSKGPKTSGENLEVILETASWLLTHSSRFTLRETYIEHDLDGTDSKNTFFFVSPRLLVHTKIKSKWRTAIIRHFGPQGMNATFVDRDRLVVARRFFHRVDE